MKRWIIGAATLALAVGCAGDVTRWERPGTSAEQLQRDQDDCMHHATIFGDPASLDPNVRARVQNDYETCMTGRGYRRTGPEKK